MEHFFYIFLIFAQNIDCRYMLELPWRGVSKEYPQSMFWSKNNRYMYTPANPFYYIKVGFKGVFIALTNFPDVPSIVQRLNSVRPNNVL